MKKGTVIGISIVVLAIIGWYYVANHTMILAKGATYYGYYDDVRGVQEAAPVYLNGVRVGKIQEIDLNIRQKVKVVFSLDKELKLHQGTKAVITTGDVSGSKAIRLVPGTETAFIAPGGILIAGFDSTMSENFHAKITPVVQSSKILLRTTDSALNSFNLFIRQGWGEETRKSFTSINHKFENAASAAGRGNQMVQRFQSTVNRLDSATKNPGERNTNVNSSLADAEKQTASASRQSPGKHIERLRTSLNNFSVTINKLKQNKMIADSQSYLNAARSFDTLDKSVQNYMKEPPPLIKIGGGKRK